MRWDLAATNTPQRALQLIGDPRSGVVDDTTQNPFGEVTVDMVHHQLSNEVYWFKYEFAGGQLRGSHRDSRLSDYTKNLMYLMRAKDPKRCVRSLAAARGRGWGPRALPHLPAAHACLCLDPSCIYICNTYALLLSWKRRP